MRRNRAFLTNTPDPEEEAAREEYSRLCSLLSTLRDKIFPPEHLQTREQMQILKETKKAIGKAMKDWNTVKANKRASRSPMLEPELESIRKIISNSGSEVNDFERIKLKLNPLGASLSEDIINQVKEGLAGKETTYEEEREQEQKEQEKLFNYLKTAVDSYEPEPEPERKETTNHEE